MKYIGIDFGIKKVGVAISDDDGRIAFPKETVPTDERRMQYICERVREGVGAIVIGDTQTMGGKKNDVTVACERFVVALKKKVEVPVYIVPEHGTSAAARAGSVEGAPRGEIQSPRAKDDHDTDARAAALILQRFLDSNP